MVFCLFCSNFVCVNRGGKGGVPGEITVEKTGFIYCGCAALGIDVV